MAKDINIGVNVDVTSIKDLRAEIKKAKDLALEFSEQPGMEKQFQAATKAAGQLKDKMNDANEQIKIMAGGSTFEKLGGSVKLMKDQVMNLDFSGAAKSMGAFNAVMMASPIFLIAAIIAAVVVAIVMLKDKLKIAEQAFDVMMIPIKALIQGLKDLSDWLGLTSFAEEEAAQASLDAANKRIAANAKVTASMDAEYGRQIALAKANGEDTVRLEVQKAAAQQNASKKTVDDLNNQIKTQSDLLKGQNRTQQEETRKNIDSLAKLRDEQVQINKNSSNEIAVIHATANKTAVDATSLKNKTFSRPAKTIVNKSYLQLKGLSLP